MQQIRYHKDPFPGRRTPQPTPDNPAWGIHVFRQSPSLALYCGCRSQDGDLLMLVEVIGSTDINDKSEWEVTVRAHVHDHLPPLSPFGKNHDEQTFDNLPETLDTLLGEYLNLRLYYHEAARTRERQNRILRADITAYLERAA